MKDQQVSKVTLTEIADYRGNLSFAEEGKPIPFKIKSVFWGKLSEKVTFRANSELFILPLDGNITINNNINLEKPCQGASVTNGTEISLKSNSENALVLIISDQKIEANDNATKNNDLLIMPSDNGYYGLKGHFANAGNTLPFDIKRVYFTYNIPEFAKRGGHAHIYTKEIVFPVKGAVNVVTDDRYIKNTYRLSNKNEGVFLDINLWRDLENFQDNSTLLVIASEKYFEPDYIRNYRDFKQYN